MHTISFACHVAPATSCGLELRVGLHLGVPSCEQDDVTKYADSGILLKASDRIARLARSR